MNKLLPMALVFALVGCLDRPTDAQQSAAASGDDTVDIGPGSIESAKAPVILTPITPVPSTAAVELNNNVGVHFYDRLAETNAAPNFVISPPAITVPLAVLYEGARGTTEQQLATFLNWGGSKSSIHSGLKAMLDSSVERAGQGPGDLILAPTHALWVQQGYPLVSNFSATLTTQYGAPPTPIDFTGDKLGVLNSINAWGKTASRGLFPDLLSSGDVRDTTRLIDVSLLYFKGGWQQPFEHASEGNFTLASGEKHLVPMMWMEGVFRYLKTDEWDAVRLDYTVPNFSMVVVAPRAGQFAQFEASLAPEFFTSLKQKLDSTALSGLGLGLPKFSAATEANLDAMLDSDGVTTLKNPATANFEGISENAIAEQLHVERMTHSAKISVDEFGTEAVGATVLLMHVTAEIPSLNVSRPFVFAIEDNVSGAILFLGRVMDPSQL